MVMVVMATPVPVIAPRQAFLSSGADQDGANDGGNSCPP
jgi:hypothetical protein